MKIGKYHYSLAVSEYVGLVGKYIRMERDATEEELEVDPDTKTIGMECLVTMVADTADNEGVVICGDWGMEFTIYPRLHEWRFAIWPSETIRKQFN